MAEGTKCVLDTIEHFKVRRVYATAEWADKYGENHIGDITIANKQQLSRMSALKTVSDVVAVYMRSVESMRRMQMLVLRLGQQACA